MQLSPEEKRLVKIVSESPQNSQTIHRIAVDHSIGEPQVMLLAESLMSKRIMFLGAPKQHGNRYLRLTDKGESYALVYCNVNFDDLVNNHPYLESKEIIKGIRKAIDGEDMRTKVTQFCTSYLIQKDLFDRDGFNIMKNRQNKWEAHSILVEWSKYVKNLSIEYPGQVDLKKWARFARIFDPDIKLDSILGISSGDTKFTLVKAKA